MSHGLSLPSPDERQLRSIANTPKQKLLALLWANRSALDALTALSPADFRPVPVLAHQRADVLQEVFDPSPAPLPTLLARLASLLAPRLEVLATDLARRLGRVRKQTTLSRIRQLDTTCLRSTARRPGRTLIEKAGPRQTLLAVQRVPRFDTMENRLLKHVAGRLQRDLRSALHHTTAPEHPRARAQRRLLLACRAITSHPDLEGLGRPRTGERPSNTLLGHPHYRAVWRASRILAQEDERFRQDWMDPAMLWSELRLLAVWSALDADPAWSPIPVLLTVRRDRPAGSSRLSIRSRRWVREDRAGRQDVTVSLDDTGCVQLLRSQATPEERQQEERQLDPLPSRDGLYASIDDPSAHVAREAKDLLADLLTPPQRLDPRPPPQPTALSALDRITHLADGTRHGTGSPAVAALCAREDRVLWSTGRPATLAEAPFGSRELFHLHPEGLAHILENELESARAVVVPDALDHRELEAMRVSLGTRWFIPSPIAAALQSEEAGALPTGPVLVLVQTAYGLELAMLDREIDQEHLAETGQSEVVWVRSSAGRQPNAPVFPEEPGHKGAWYRAEHSPAWYLTQSGHARRPDAPVLPELADSVQAFRAEDQRSPCALITCGVDTDSIPTELTALPRVELMPRDLALGAARFLRRHDQGLPTWVEHLQSIEVETSAGRTRQRVPLLEACRVRPGQHLANTSAPIIVMPRGQRELTLPFFEGRAATPYRLLVDGAPLPLERSTNVSVHVEWCYGQGGLSGELRAADSDEFRSIPFRLVSGERTSPGGPASPPADRAVLVEDTLVEALEEHLSQLDQVLFPRRGKRKKRLDQATREQATQILKAMTQAARCIERTDAESLSPELRTRLSSIASFLDRLLAGQSPRGRIRLPEIEGALRRARASLGVHTPSLDVQGLLEEGNGLMLLSTVVDGQRESLMAIAGCSPKEGRLAPDWGKSVAMALRRNPAVLACLTEDDGLQILERALEGLEHQAAQPRPNKAAVFGFARALQELVYLREHGLLPPEATQCLQAVGRCRRVQAALPESVRNYGERSSRVTEREQLAVAIDWLGGDYAARTRTEEA